MPSRKSRKITPVTVTSIHNHSHAGLNSTQLPCLVIYYVNGEPESLILVGISDQCKFEPNTHNSVQKITQHKVQYEKGNFNAVSHHHHHPPPSLTQRYVTKANLRLANWLTQN